MVQVSIKTKVRGASVIVVGGGIIGSAIAYRLACRGAAVTLVDKAVPGSGVTGSSFAWIGSSGDWPGAAAVLREQAVPEWRGLQAELPEVSVRWCGSLWLDGGRREAAGSRAAAGWRLLTPSEVVAVEPRLGGTGRSGLFWPGDGFVDPRAAVGALLRAAARRGARVLSGIEVRSLVNEGGRVVGVTTSWGTLRGDVVVLAAGVTTAALAASIDANLPVEASPAVLVRLEAAAGLVRTVAVTADLEVHEDTGVANGGLVAAVGLEVGATPEDLFAVGQRVASRVKRLFGATNVGLRGMEIGIRPIPKDGAPIVGRLSNTPGVYLAVMHSGVTLAPLVAHLAAEEICTGVNLTALDGCRPTRFHHAATS